MRNVLLRILFIINGFAFGYGAFYVGSIIVWVMLFTGKCNGATFCNLLFYVGVFAQIAGPIIGVVIAIGSQLLPGLIKASGAPPSTVESTFIIPVPPTRPGRKLS